MKKLIVTLIASSLLTGCMSVNMPKRNQYMLKATTPLILNTTTTKQTIRIQQTTAIAPYNSNEFIYRLKGQKYLNDFYNIFLENHSLKLSLAL